VKLNRRPPLASIDRKLTKAAELLDAAAADLRDVGLSSRENIRKIGTVFVTVFEIQHEIYRREPTLAPSYLMDSLGQLFVANFSRLSPHSKHLLHRCLRYRVCQYLQQTRHNEEFL
jgi:hypothetical protein